jgi:hypothetical protein
MLFGIRSIILLYLCPRHTENKEEKDFTKEEIEIFERRYENQYNIKTDEGYNKWAEKNQKTDLKLGRLPFVLKGNSMALHPLPKSVKTFKFPSLPSINPTGGPSSCIAKATILTSQQNLNYWRPRKRKE